MPDHLDLHQALKHGFDVLQRVREESPPSLAVEEVGEVSSVASGVVRMSSMPGLKSEELVRLPGDRLAMVFDLQPQQVGLILMDEAGDLSSGDEVRRTGRVLDIPVGDNLLGRVVDPQGRPLDGKGNLHISRREPVEKPAPEIMDRAPVTEPLQTGLKVIDALIPIGRGQRELILGDRQTGKTAAAVDAMINQKGENVVCIYCAIGKRGSAVARVMESLSQHEAFEHSLVVAATEDEPPGLQFIAPYAATTIGEFFMEQGRDVLIVLDDLTRHARAYREMSLLLRRPPGREAYPGDIFYIHSRLLERYTHLRPEHGGGSMTALPIVETEAQNISAYIPTNIISITDGQVYLSPELFRKGVLPAVDVGKSVSRVGGKTQLPAYRRVAGDLRLSYSQFEELETFARFGTRMDEETRRTLERGRRVREALKQPQYQPLSVAAQIAVLVAVNRGVFDPLPLEAVESAQQEVQTRVRHELGGLVEKIESGEKLDDEEVDDLSRAAQEAVAGFQKESQ